MSWETPTAMIVGREMFGADKLVENLEKKEIRVVGEGEKSWEEVDYIFDFRGETDWGKVGLKGETKLTMVAINNRKLAAEMKRKMAEEINLDWRVVEGVGVYGLGMEEAREGVDFLVEAIRLAVLNQNLVLLTAGTEVRLLAMDDLVEAILRATFLRGIEREVVVVGGERLGMEEIAKVLMDQAKMTRRKVMTKKEEIEERGEEEIVRGWERLHWRPEMSFKQGMVETLQYFFSKIEEERRNTKHQTTNYKQIPNSKLQITKEYEVVVDDVIEETKNKKQEQEGELKADFEIKNIKEVEPEPEPEAVPTDRQVVEVREDEDIRYQMLDVSKIEPIKIKKRNWGWVGRGMVILMILAAAGWGLNWIGQGVGAVRTVMGVEKLIKARKYDEAVRMTEGAVKTINRLDEGIDGWRGNRFLWLRNYQTVLRTAKEALLLQEKGIEMARKGEAIKGAIFGEKEIDWSRELGEMKMIMSELGERTGRLEARLSGDWSFLPGNWRAWGQKKAVDLGKIREKVEQGRKGMEMLPELLGLDGRRREYLVVLQNEMELRPGGGFIGSYGILSWENGRLINFEIKDVYEADGQLKGHVEPPEEIKKYLGEAGWYLRDANWQASFPAAAKDMEWFLEKETGRRVDGVIGVNLAVARGILGVTGEVFVADFKEKINKDNLYEQAEFYAENKFFGGSKQKANFLGSLSKYLFEEIKGLETEKLAELLGEVLDKLEENEIQVVVGEKRTAGLLAAAGWDGAMYDGKCPTTAGCLADYLYLVEANLGVNKANYFVYRKVEELVEISANLVSRVVKISYENTAKNNNWPGGDYKNYLRVYLPGGVNLAEVSVADGNKSGNRRVYGENELKVRTVGDKREVGFLVVVPVGQRREVEIRYSSGVTISEKFSYLNYIQKQSGYGETGLVVLVTLPTGWQPLEVQPAASVVGGKLLFNTKLERDIKMGVEIGK